MGEIAGVKSEVRFNVAPMQDIPVALQSFDFITAQLLLQRGIDNKESADKFLNPAIEDLGDPSLLTDMDKAVERIKGAIQNKEKITIYGDYDVDGVTSATVLVSALRSLKAQVDVYLPERLKEGYGLNKDAIKNLRDSGTDLLVTVDNGTTNVKEIEFANSLGLDVIVVDHHQVGEKLPPAYALINPHQPGNKYPYKDMAAVGVVYHLVRKLIGDEEAKEYLDLVAMGTVADIVPLVGDNRIFTIFGLKQLNQTKRVGIKALIDVAGLKGKELEAYHLGFQLGPRINAAGRMEHANKAFDLINEMDETKANKLALDLNDLNAKRQKMTEQILESVMAQSDDWQNKKIIIVGSKDWSVGVVGIVASKLTESFSKPSIVFEYQEDVCKGSARSVDGVHLVKLLDSVSEYIQGYGGHAKAAGMTIEKSKFADFKASLENWAAKSIDVDWLRPSVNVSLILKSNFVEDRLLKTISKFAPFGFGNSTPIFGVRRVRLGGIDVLGKTGSVVKMIFMDGEKRIQITGFDKNKELVKTLQEGGEYNITFTISNKEWKGRRFINKNLVRLKLLS